MRDRVNLVVLVRRWYQSGLAVAAVIAVLVAYRNGVIQSDSPWALADLHVYRETLEQWWKVRDTTSLFDVRSSDGLPFFYPTSAIPILLPLTWFPGAVIDASWTALLLVVSAIVAIAIAVRASQHHDSPLGHAPDLPQLIAGSAGTIAIVWASPPIWDSGFWGNVSALIALTAFLDAAGFIPSKFRGILIGLGASLKLTPLLFVAYFVLTKQWRAAVTSASVFGVLTIVTAVLWPSEFVRFWTEIANNTGMSLGNLASPWNWSIVGLFERFQFTGPASTQVARAVAVVILACSLWRARAHALLGDTVSAAIVLGCASAVVTPIAWIHYHAFTVLALLWVLLRRRSLSVALAAVFFLMIGDFVKNPMPTGDIQSDVATLIPIVIALFGLPRSGSSTVPGTSTALDAATASATASDAGRQLDDSRGTNTANTDSPNGR